MKIFIRAFVIVLALTGAVASTQTSSASAHTIASSTHPLMAPPVPTCPPDTGGKNPCNVGAQQK